MTYLLNVSIMPKINVLLGTSNAFSLAAADALSTHLTAHAAQEEELLASFRMERRVVDVLVVPQLIHR